VPRRARPGHLAAEEEQAREGGPRVAVARGAAGGRSVDHAAGGDRLLAVERGGGHVAEQVGDAVDREARGLQVGVQCRERGVIGVRGGVGARGGGAQGRGHGSTVTVRPGSPR